MISRYELKQALDQMLHHRLRTALTLLGMIFGVGAVVAMQNIGEGAERAALKAIESLGLYTVVADYQPVASAQDEAKDLSIGLSTQDRRVIFELPFVEDVSAGIKLDVEQVFSASGNATPEVWGVSDNYLDRASQVASSGRMLDSDDFIKSRQAVVMTESVARQLFEADPIGQVVKINHLWFEVVGVIANESESSARIEGLDNSGERYRIYLPETTFNQKLRRDTESSEYSQLKIHLFEDVPQTAAAGVVKDLLIRRHGGLEDFSMTVPADLLEQHRKTQSVFNWVMSAVAGISLLVGGIGIMNIMLATVLERTQEIGLRRAIGARKQDITHQFLVETLVITFVGAILGIVFGVILSVLIAALAGWEVAFSLLAILSAVVVCSVIGLGFGIYPAKRAAELNPIEALQHA